MSRQRVISVPEWGYLGARHTLVSRRNIAAQGGGRGDGRKSVGYKSRRKERKLDRNRPNQRGGGYKAPANYLTLLQYSGVSRDDGALERATKKPK